MISVLILTLNEEQNLARCLDSVKWSDDVVVFDSFSSDATVEIARAAGARVVQRTFDNERDHRAASLKLPFKHTWVYNPDADEIATPELCDEMRQVVEEKRRPEVAYRARFKTMFMGRWIRHSSLYPTWVVRLFKPEAITFERAINLRYVIQGPAGRLDNHFEHYTFNKGLNAWLEKHNRYSWHEAEESLKSLEGGQWTARRCLREAFGAKDPAGRRRALKELSFRVPCRPAFRFLYMYVLRLGFLDGLPGYHYCRLLALYEYLIVLKMKELQRRRQGLPF
jgi:glycosyltransferase involved in cell wall biosynthesis